MIARIWRGETRDSHADAYLAYLEQTGISDARTTPGNRGVWVLRRIVDGRAEFLFISLWESLEAIRAFAGAEIETAVYYPEDARFLLAMAPTVAHYDVLVAG